MNENKPPRPDSSDNFTPKQYDFRINLSFQINRIAELLSSKVNTTEGNDYLNAQKILVNAKLNAVDTLAAMLRFYLKNDEEYVSELNKMIKTYNTKCDKNISDMEKTTYKEELAENKFALLMEFMGRSQWLIKRSVTAEDDDAEVAAEAEAEVETEDVVHEG